MLHFSDTSEVVMNDLYRRLPPGCSGALIPDATAITPVRIAPVLLIKQTREMVRIVSAPALSTDVAFSPHRCETNATFA